MSLLEISDLTFGYGPTNIFRDLNFAVDRGEIFCILGPNGCGKTTLFDCILGLHRPRQGRILINGRDHQTLKTWEKARLISYVPQNHEKSFPYTVTQVVQMGRTAHIGFFESPGRDDVRIAEEAMDRVGIRHLAKRRYTELSGGEMQMVMIARALAQQAPLIIMDEPTSHLDFQNELRVMETMVQMVRDGLTILMATHSPNHVLYFESQNINTRVALMSQANFLMIGEPCRVISTENLRRVYNVEARVISFELGQTCRMRQVFPIGVDKQDDLS